jgi:hypothetical protein
MSIKTLFPGVRAAAKFEIPAYTLSEANQAEAFMSHWMETIHVSQS